MKISQFIIVKHFFSKFLHENNAVVITAVIVLGILGMNFIPVESETPALIPLNTDDTVDIIRNAVNTPSVTSNGNISIRDSYGPYPYDGGAWHDFSFVIPSGFSKVRAMPYGWGFNGQYRINGNQFANDHMISGIDITTLVFAGANIGGVSHNDASPWGAYIETNIVASYLNLGSTDNSRHLITTFILNSASSTYIYAFNTYGLIKWPVTSNLTVNGVPVATTGLVDITFAVMTGPNTVNFNFTDTGVFGLLAFSPVTELSDAKPENNYKVNFISKINTIGALSDPSYGPTGLAVNNSGFLYEADYSSGLIKVFNQANTYVDDFSLATPRDIKFNSSGYIFAASEYKFCIFAPDHTLLKTIGSQGSGDGQFNFAASLSINQTNFVYVADYNNHRIQIFDTAGNFVTKFGIAGTAPGQLNYPFGISHDSAGNVYVSEWGTDRISVFTSTGTFLRTFGSYGTSAAGGRRFNEPSGICISNDYLFVSDQLNHRVQILDVNGTFLTEFGGFGNENGFLRSPDGIFVTPCGRIYVSNINYRVVSIFTAPFATISRVTQTPSEPHVAKVVKVSAQMRNETLLVNAQVYYRINATGWITQNMVYVSGRTYQNPGFGPFSLGDTIQYYINATYTSCSVINNNNGAYYNFTVTSDVKGPTITNIGHNPLFPTEIDPIIFSAAVDDPSGIFNVTFHYRVNTGSWSSINMTLSSGITYQTTQLGPILTTDIIQYYITAIDNSTGYNIQIADNNGYFYYFRLMNPTDAAIYINPPVLFGNELLYIWIEDLDRNIQTQYPGGTDEITAHVTSDTDGSGMNITLQEMDVNTGVFCSVIQPNTYTSGTEAIPCIQVSPIDKITVQYVDTNATRQVITIRQTIVYYSTVVTIGILDFNQDNYTTSDTSVITVVDFDRNVDLLQPDNVTVHVWSSVDSQGFDLILNEVGANSGLFENTITFSETTSGFKVLYVGVVAAIYISYLDEENGFGSSMLLQDVAIYESNVPDAAYPIVISSELPNVIYSHDSIPITVQISIYMPIKTVYAVELLSNTKVELNLVTTSELNFTYTGLIQIDVLTDAKEIQLRIEAVLVNDDVKTSQVYYITAILPDLFVALATDSSILEYSTYQQFTLSLETSTANVTLELRMVNELSALQFTLYSGTMTDTTFKYIVLRDEAYIPGKWSIYAFINKNGYNSGNTSAPFTIETPYHAYTGSNTFTIGEKNVVITLLANQEFWMDLKFYPAPHSIVIPSSYEILNNQSLNLLGYGYNTSLGSPIVNCSINIQRLNIEAYQRQGTLYYSNNGNEWSLRATINFYDNNISLQLTDFGWYCLAATPLLSPDTSTSEQSQPVFTPGFTIFGLFSLIGIILLLRGLKHNHKGGF